MRINENHAVMLGLSESVQFVCVACFTSQVTGRRAKPRRGAVVRLDLDEEGGEEGRREDRLDGEHTSGERRIRLDLDAEDTGDTARSRLNLDLDDEVCGEAMSHLDLDA